MTQLPSHEPPLEEAVAVDEEVGENSSHLFVRDVPILSDSAALLPSTTADNTHKSGVVWAEARVAEDGIPSEVVAIAMVDVVPVEIDNETLTLSTAPHPTNASAAHPTTTADTQFSPGMDGEHRAPATCASLYPWNFVVCIVGNSLLVAALATTFGLELGAGVLYFVAALFYWIAEGCRKIGHWTLLLQTIFRFVSALLLKLDFLLVTISSLVVEILAWTAGMVCMLFGGIAVGTAMHQHIRRVCEALRFRCRCVYADWNPQRLRSFGSFNDDDVEEEHPVLG
jgi:hypothetical protein